jgi:tRNA-splicing ligase RtcB
LASAVSNRYPAIDRRQLCLSAASGVLAEHAGSIKVLHTLRPFAVAMADENEFDPFKD